MRTTVFVFFAACLATAVAIRAETGPENNQVDGYAVFNDLSKEDASKKAREMAETDFARNVYRMFVAGKPHAKSTYDDYLKEKYEVVVTSIAGCIVSEGIEGAIDGYNSTMQPLLNRKFGRDIVKEAEEASRR
jgi:hypothetical protein